MPTPIEEIKRKIDIVELVGESVPLKQSGRNWKANCPFHNERTPSFYVFPERQTWHCFGACATGGDAFGFVMRRDGVLFGEALRTLAQRAGVTLASPQASREHADRLERLRALNRAAALFFHRTLVERPEGKPALDYLEKRGLNRQTIEEYRLGYSPESAAALIRSLSSDGFTQDELAAAGLIRKREGDGSLYGFFRNRLMIPIQDARGDYLGFGARALDDAVPKYLNSSQSALFDKSAILYGIHQAADAIKKEGLAVIVEGYMDALMAHQEGFRNVVASMGTALTDKQVSTLKRLAHSFVLALDPDAAGDEATLRSLEGAWRVLDRPSPSLGPRLTGPQAEEITLRVMDLPRGKDPDDLIREDPARWAELAAGATPLVEYLFRAMAQRVDTSTPQGKADLIQRLVPLIRNAPNAVEQNSRIQRLAKLVEVDENRVEVAVKQSRGSQQPSVRRRGGITEPAPSLLTPPARDPLEAYCVAMVLRYPELLPSTGSDSSPHLSPEYLTSAPLREIFQLLSTGASLDAPSEQLGPHLLEEVEALRQHPLPSANPREREQGLWQATLRLRERHERLLLTALAESEASAEELGAARERLASLQAQLAALPAR